MRSPSPNEDSRDFALCMLICLNQYTASDLSDLSALGKAMTSVVRSVLQSTYLVRPKSRTYREGFLKFAHMLASEREPNS